jgi:hypothetical protein
MALAFRLPQFIIAAVGLSTGAAQLERTALAAGARANESPQAQAPVAPAAPPSPAPASAPAPILPPVYLTAPPAPNPPAPSPAPVYPPAGTVPSQAQPLSMPPQSTTNGLVAQAGARGPERPCPDSDASGLRRGLVLLPYVGVQFPVKGADWISTGYRIGTLIGGHLNERFSLNAELGFATWTWESSGDSHHAGQLDVALTFLHHVATSWGGFIVGPRAGRALVFRNDGSDDPTVFINGWLLGGKFGLLASVPGDLAVGFVVDLSYIVNPVKPGAYCYYSENYECSSQTRNTFLGSLAATVLF